LSFDDFISNYFMPYILKVSKGNIFIYGEIHEGKEWLILKRYFNGKRRTVIFSHTVLQKNNQKYQQYNK